MRPGDDVALNISELRLRLFHGKLLVSARLLKHLPARRDATKAAARRHRFDIGIEELRRRLELMRRDSLDELTRAGELPRRSLTPAKTILKLAGSRWNAGPTPRADDSVSRARADTRRCSEPQGSIERTAPVLLESHRRGMEASPAASNKPDGYARAGQARAAAALHALTSVETSCC
jgi:hypothetical protein